MVASFVVGAEMAMISAGMDIKPGSGISKAIEYWSATSKVIPTRE
jgi:alanine-glyoxylate transaminase/serine-glyoxylate transaminase/serine-pyruvate transaminase